MKTTTIPLSLQVQIKGRLIGLFLLYISLCLPGNSTVAYGSNILPKLLQPHLIIGPLEQDSETVKVIVNLFESHDKVVTKAQGAIDTLQSRGNVLDSIKTSVVSRVSPQSIKIRHYFKGIPAFSAEVTALGLVDLVNHPWVKSIEPIEELLPLVVEGISLMGGTEYRSQYGGRGTAVAIIDDGIDYRHPMLGGGSFPNSKVIGGYDTGEDDSDPLPRLNNGVYLGHGTPCAGIVAGNTGGTYPYIGGVAPDAKLYALKMTEQGDDGQPKIMGDAITDAILWCVEHKNDDPANPIVAINISLGGSKRYFAPCDAEEAASGVQAVNRAFAAGITVVQASGNNGYCDSMVAGACLTNTISVGGVYDADFGASGVGCISPGSCIGWGPEDGCGCGTGWCYQDMTTAADQVAGYSNTAPFLDLLAPSNNAYTTGVSAQDGASAGGYTEFGGTSAASPYAAGAVACLQSAAKALIGHFLSPNEVRDTLAATGDPVTDHKSIPLTTIPRINVARAIESLSQQSNARVIYSETFTAGALYASKWSKNSGSKVDDKGRNEPSPGYSLHLDGHPSGGDTATSKTLDLSSYREATFYYWYERAGNENSPEIGDDLIVDYLASSGWRELSRQSGDGPDMGGYEKAMAKLPGDALHADFRFRIRNIGLASKTQSYDSWFVDDIAIKVVDQDAFSGDAIYTAVYGDHTVSLTWSAKDQTYSGHLALTLDAQVRMRLVAEARAASDGGGTWRAWTMPETIGPGSSLPVELWVEGSGLVVDQMDTGVGDVVLASIELGGVSAQ